MKKFFLSLFILLDLAVIGGAGYFLYAHVTGKAVMTSLPPAVRAHAAPGGPIPSTGTPAPVMPAVLSSSGSAAAPIPPTSPYRNIGFKYKNAKAKQVLIRADFTGWKGVPMKRGPDGTWTYTQQLTPGEYAYCFTVDNKIIKDPANKHTKRIAQTPVSSIVVSKAGTPEKKPVEP